MLNKSTFPHIFLLVCLIANVVTLPSVTAKSARSESSQASLGNDEIEFTFTGRCLSGDAYRIFSYQMDVDGLSQSFYDYEGPAGKGTVQTNTTPKKFAVRICHTQADIHSGSRFDWSVQPAFLNAHKSHRPMVLEHIAYWTNNPTTLAWTCEFEHWTAPITAYFENINGAFVYWVQVLDETY